jgi:hypothetical protein
MSEETTTEMALYEIARRRQAGDYIAIPATSAFSDCGVPGAGQKNTGGACLVAKRPTLFPAQLRITI